MLNSISLCGRLTANPQMRDVNGTPVANFTLAVERDYQGQDGKRPVDFIDCVAWKNSANFVHKYFSKGQMAVVTGRLQMRDWTDKNGNKRRSAEVNVSSVYFCGSKSENAHMAETGDAPASDALAAQGFVDIDSADSDLPF